MIDRIYESATEILNRDAYLAEYWRTYERVGGVCWKFERGQSFREAGDASWEAFAAGDWNRALALNEADRTEAEAMVRRDREAGVETRRIRVVERPVTPYVQWEMQFLRMLAEAGQSLRVLVEAQVVHLEHERALPEIVVLGDQVLYLVRHDPNGNACGAWKIRETDVIAQCQEDLAKLFAAGDSLVDFFDGEIAPLPPPVVER